MFRRIINLPDSLSFFLFGARATGKSSLIAERFDLQSTYIIDLLVSAEEDRFSRDPDLFARLVEGLPPEMTTVVIDEVQKVPRLLDVVHHLIAKNSPIRFILTGSSARKLKRGGANLLAGRALLRNLFPLTENELGETFSLPHALQWGSLPALFSFSDDEARFDYLQAYAFTYLKEEIQIEQAVRSLDPFRRFLEVSAQMNNKPLNFAAIARDVGADSKTVQSYYQVLEDTLLGTMIDPYHSSLRKRLRLAPKFLYFDIGVARALGRVLSVAPMPGTSYYGELFEQHVILELSRAFSYARSEARFHYLQTHDGLEIDLVIERPGVPLILIEIKSTTTVRDEHVRSLERVGVDIPNSHRYCLSNDPKTQKFGSIEAMHWRKGVQMIAGMV